MRHLVATLLLLSFLVAGCGGLRPSAGERAVVTFALLDDPSRDLFLYALTEGKVASAAVAVQIHQLPMASIIEAVASREYDLVEAATVTVPKAHQRGFPLLIASSGLINYGGSRVYVLPDSPLPDLGSLAGRTLATSSLGGTFMLEARYVLARRYGLNPDLLRGDVAFQEVPPETVFTLLSDRRLDAALLMHAPAYRLETAGFRVLANVTEEFRTLTGYPVLNSVLITYPSVAEAKEESLVQALELLRASAAYARAHPDEVIAEVARRRRVSEDFLRWWLAAHDFRQGESPAADVGPLRAVWEAAVGGHPPTKLLTPCMIHPMDSNGIDRHARGKIRWGRR